MVFVRAAFAAFVRLSADFFCNKDLLYFFFRMLAP